MGALDGGVMLRGERTRMEGRGRRGKAGSMAGGGEAGTSLRA